MLAGRVLSYRSRESFLPGELQPLTWKTPSSTQRGVNSPDSREVKRPMLPAPWCPRWDWSPAEHNSSVTPPPPLLQRHRSCSVHTAAKGKGRPTARWDSRALLVLWSSLCHPEHLISRNQCLPGLKKINKQLLGKLLKISNTFQNQKGKVHLTWKLYCAGEAEVSPPKTEETSENWRKCGKVPWAPPGETASTHSYYLWT